MIREALSFASADFPVWVLRLVFSVTLVCLSAGLANLLLRRFSAAMRHRVWALGVAASLTMPVMILWSPELRLGWLSVAKPRPALRADSPLVADLEPASPAIEFDHRVFEAQGAEANALPRRATPSGNTSRPRALPQQNQLPAVDTPSDSSTSPRSRMVAAAATQAPSVSRIDPNTVWLLILVAPAVCGIWQSVRSARAVRRVVDEARLVTDAATMELIADVCRRLHWDGVVDLRQSSRTPIPLCVGWKRPCILLPPEWRSWGDMTLRAVLAHEVSHIVRRDVAWQMVARVACYLYWFHPLVWLAARKMRVERETACDDSVLAIVERPVDYASVLLRFAREMVAHRTPAAALPMSSFSGLEGRVRAILDKSRPRSPVGPRVSRLCALAAILVAGAAASLSPLSREGVAAANDTNARKIDSQAASTGESDATSSQMKSEWLSVDAPRSPAGNISGRVVFKADSKRGVAKAKILGIPDNPRASYVTAVADAQGNFHLPRTRSVMLLLAQSDERTLSGIARIEPEESGVVIPVGRPVKAHGRLLDFAGKPLASWPMEYCLVLEGSFLDDFHVFQARDAKRLLGGNAYSGPNGEFELPVLAPGLKYRITCCPGVTVNGAIQPFITITSFTSAQTGTTQLGDVKRPRTQTMDDVFLSATSPPEQVEKVLETATESAGQLDQRVLIVAGSRKNEIVRGIRAILAMSSPVAYAPGVDATAGNPEWAKDESLRAALFNYSVLGVEVAGKGATTVPFLERYKIKKPADNDVALAALDIDGRLVAATSGRQLFAGKEPSAEPLGKWLRTNAPKLPDAETLLTKALKDAKREGKRVFLRENSPAAGGYSIRLDHYVAQYKDLLEKDYVCLKIDVRYANADKVINGFRDYDYNDLRGGGYSLPWVMILDAAGRPLVSGTSPRGNIGIPESEQETSYFEWMLRATAKQLTDQEIATLVSALKHKR